LKLLIAKSAGFCFGVKRAIEIALKATQKYNKDLYTLGPIIHNPQTVDLLKNLGIKVINHIEDIPRGTVIFRSHGVSLKDLEKAKKKKLNLIDATCPIVKRVQLFAKYLNKHGYDLLIVGDPRHPEVEAIQSYLNDRVNVVENIGDIKRLGPWKKLGIVAQTTQSMALFKEIVMASLERAEEVRVFNTICHATAIRQKEAVNIAKKADCMIVIGGYNSGNTQRLVTICKEIQPNTYHIEEAKELKLKWLKGCKIVGLTAGASTPSWVIHEVAKEIKKLKNQKIQKFRKRIFFFVNPPQIPAG